MLPLSHRPQTITPLQEPLAFKDNKNVSLLIAPPPNHLLPSPPLEMVRSLSATTMLGRTVDGGRLRLVKVLGAGSSGVVFLALEQTLDYPNGVVYAVKCIARADRGTSQNHMQRRETAFHRSVSSHPNVLTLHRVFEEGRYVFFVLDYYSGGDLFKLITEGGCFRGNDEMVKKIFLQILDAVDACHKRGIYHRDIKPENILCSADRTKVCLADFGLATKSIFSSNFGAGSFSYMSPECIGFELKPKAYSSQSNDVWALGVILTSMISGRNPWRYATTSDECYSSYLNNPNFLRSMLPISKGADEILRRIFTRYEFSRISLSYLRQMVVNVDTFFMTQAEIANASEQVRKVAASYYGIDPLDPNLQNTNTSYGLLVPESSIVCPNTPQSDLESEGNPSIRDRPNGLLEIVEVALSPRNTNPQSCDDALVNSPQILCGDGATGFEEELMELRDIRPLGVDFHSTVPARDTPLSSGRKEHRAFSTVSLIRRLVQRIVE